MKFLKTNTILVAVTLLLAYSSVSVACSTLSAEDSGTRTKVPNMNLWDLFGGPPVPRDDSGCILDLRRMTDEEIKEYWDNLMKQSHSADNAIAGSANCNLGILLLNGDRVSKDKKRAFKRFLMAAKLGDKDSMCNLGSLYLDPDVERDVTKAIEWFTRADSLGVVGAACNLGVLYSTGNGVAKDVVKAVAYFTRAATAGHPMAQHNLGILYYAGDGIPKDTRQAARWFTDAAKAGYAKAQYDLGILYCTGDGVPEDMGQAAVWFKRAAEAGHTKAQYNLGRCYADGKDCLKIWSKL